MKSYDCTVIVIAYEAGNTIERCIRSIFEQEVEGYQVLILVGYDYSKDDTYQKLIELAEKSPAWAEFRIIVNTKPPIIIDGMKTGRSNFLNCYSKAKGRAILFCDCDDSWGDQKKLVRQLELTLETGKGSYTDASAVQAPQNYNPFLQGNQVIFSSLCIPAKFPPTDLMARVRLLDWYLVCLCYQGPGLEYVDSMVEYSLENGYWTSHSQSDRIKSTLSTAAMLLEDGGFDFFQRLFIRIYMMRLRLILVRGVARLR